MNWGCVIASDIGNLNMGKLKIDSCKYQQILMKMDLEVY